MWLCILWVVLGKFIVLCMGVLKAPPVQLVLKVCSTVRRLLRTAGQYSKGPVPDDCIPANRAQSGPDLAIVVKTCICIPTCCKWEWKWSRSPYPLATLCGLLCGLNYHPVYIYNKTVKAPCSFFTGKSPHEHGPEA